LLPHVSLVVVWTDNEIFSTGIGKVFTEVESPLNAPEDSGALMSFTYEKKFPDTSLRLTASGDHRSAYKSGYSGCGRW